MTELAPMPGSPEVRLGLDGAGPDVPSLPAFSLPLSHALEGWAFRSYFAR